MSWQVDISEYIGNGQWKVCNPLIYDSIEEAEQFEKLVNINLQVGGNFRVDKISQIKDLSLREV